MFQLLSELARNDVTVVCKAQELRSNRLVALKVVLSINDVPARERLWAEFRMMAACHHMGTLRAFCSGDLDGRAFFAMELTEGSLADKLTETRSPRDAAEIVKSVAQAIAHLHRNDVAHRRITLDHILIDKDGRAKLGGFSAAIMCHEHTPDAYAKAVAADIRGLGVVLNEIVSGQPMKDEKLAAWPEKVDPDLAAISLSCLERDTNRRIADASKVAEALDQWLNKKKGWFRQRKR